jgi:hypothetical protein
MISTFMGKKLLVIMALALLWGGGVKAFGFCVNGGPHSIGIVILTGDFHHHPPNTRDVKEFKVNTLQRFEKGQRVFIGPWPVVDDRFRYNNQPFFGDDGNVYLIRNSVSDSNVSGHRDSVVIVNATGHAFSFKLSNVTMINFIPPYRVGRASIPSYLPSVTVTTEYDTNQGPVVGPEQRGVMKGRFFILGVKDGNVKAFDLTNRFP